MLRVLRLAASEPACVRHLPQRCRLIPPERHERFPIRTKTHVPDGRRSAERVPQHRVAGVPLADGRRPECRRRVRACRLGIARRLGPRTGPSANGIAARGPAAATCCPLARSMSAICAIRVSNSPPDLSGHADRLAACMCRNSSGILVFSMRTGIRMPRALPSRASVLTQSDRTDTPDHSTRMQRAASTCSSMTSSKLLPKGILRSHQTDQPCFSSAPAISLARSRSSLE